MQRHDAKRAHPAAMTAASTYDPDVGRPRKRPEDRFVTPAKSFRPYPPELWEQAKATAAANGENVTDVLNRALAEYVRKGKP